MGRPHLSKNRKKSKFYIPHDVKATYGEWTVIDGTIGSLPEKTHNLYYWKVRCSCGTEGLRLAGSIMSGEYKRCSKCGLKRKKYATKEEKRIANNRMDRKRYRRYEADRDAMVSQCVERLEDLGFKVTLESS